MAVGIDMRGLLMAADAVRGDAHSTVRALQQRGLRVLLISGVCLACSSAIMLSTLCANTFQSASWVCPL